MNKIEVKQRMNEREKSIVSLKESIASLQKEMDKLKSEQRQDELLISTELKSILGKTYIPTDLTRRRTMRGVIAIKVIGIFDNGFVKILKIMNGGWSLLYGSEYCIKEEVLTNFFEVMKDLKEIDQQAFQKLFEKVVSNLASRVQKEQD